MELKTTIDVSKKREIVRAYICNNPNCTYLDIRRDTKIKIERIYKNMPEAYIDANIRLSKNLTKRNKEKQKMEVIQIIKQNPGCTVTDIYNKTKVNVIRTFGSIVNAYNAANVKYPKKEITSGVMNPYVVRRSNKFEKDIISLLAKFGEVKPRVRTAAGIVDCLLSYKGTKLAVEIKDFRGKNNITMYELKQLVRYMKALGYKKGILVCPKEKFPKRKNHRNVYIDDLEIKLLSEEDLRGRSIMD